MKRKTLASMRTAWRFQVRESSCRKCTFFTMGEETDCRVFVNSIIIKMKKFIESFISGYKKINKPEEKQAAKKF